MTSFFLNLTLKPLTLEHKNLSGILAIKSSIAPKTGMEVEYLLKKKLWNWNDYVVEKENKVCSLSFKFKTIRVITPWHLEGTG